MNESFCLSVNLLSKEAYFSQVTVLEDWWQANKLEMNVAKTKELKENQVEPVTSSLS